MDCRQSFNSISNIMVHDAEGYELCIKAYEICNRVENLGPKKTRKGYFLLNSEGDVP